jgi:predicted acylesterase/phospholipase RssA
LTTPMPDPQIAADRFQILSLDGGGLRGMYTAAVLARLEEDLGIRIVDHFDLIAGTSTGGIIALGLGLGLGMTPREILEFYTAHGPRIFRDRTRLRSLRRVADEYCRDPAKIDKTRLPTLTARGVSPELVKVACQTFTELRVRAL